MAADIIQLKQVTVGYPVRGGLFSRVRGYSKVLQAVDLAIPRGKTLGLVGESGCGKTTLGRALLGLVPVQSGEILYFPKQESGGSPVSLHELNEASFRPLRQKLQIVFQDPFSSLNPRLQVEEILTEGYRYHFPGKTAAERREACLAVLERVGLSRSSLDRYPHEFSGGQRQRISIARALILEPDFVVCDECVSALDVSIQAQIINLLIDLQEELGLSYLFISHDLAVVRHISHNIAVIDAGKIVEYGPASEVADRPRHEYTRKLIAAVPSLEPAL